MKDTIQSVTHEVEQATILVHELFNQQQEEMKRALKKLNLAQCKLAAFVAVMPE